MQHFLHNYSKEEILAGVQKERLKRLLEDDFSKFLQYGFLRQTKKTFTYNWHHKEMGDHLNMVHNGDILNLLMNIPPRYSKTVMVIYFIAWTYAKNPRCNYIHLSYSDALVKLNSETIKEIIKSPWFQDMWPLEISKKSDSKDEWKIVGGGTFYAAATGGQITGRGAGAPDPDDKDNAYDWMEAFNDYLETVHMDSESSNEYSGGIIIDDPLKPDDARSDVMLKKVNDRLNSTILSRKNSPRHTPIIIMMQRLHENDMTGFCLAGGTAEEWVQLKLAAIQYEDDGKEFALWPNKHTLEELKKIKKTDPLMFSGQYDQEPSPVEGDLFKRESWKIIDEMPKFGRCVRGYDLAASKTNSSPFTSSVKMAKFELGYLILDVTNERFTPDEVEAHMKLNATLDGHGTKIDFPQDPGQAGKFQAGYLIKKLAGYTVSASPETGSKQYRATALSSQQSVGNVYLLKGDWNKEFIDQAAKFPNGTFMDMIDASSRAFHHLESSKSSIFDAI